MRIVDEAETVAWFAAKGFGDLGGLPSLSSVVLSSIFPRKATYWVTDLAARKKTAMARMLADRFCESGGGMLWIDEWGIWPSCENMTLFEGYRKSLDETRWLIDSPGHIFATEDRDTVFSLLSLALYFIWGGILASSSGDMAVRFSHDEWIDVFARGGAESGDELFSSMAFWPGNQHEWMLSKFG